jgi:hypothetical protein
MITICDVLTILYYLNAKDESLRSIISSVTINLCELSIKGSIYRNKLTALSKVRILSQHYL